MQQQVKDYLLAEVLWELVAVEGRQKIIDPKINGVQDLAIFCSECPFFYSIWSLYVS